MGMSSCSAEAQSHLSLSGLVQNYTGSALSGFVPGVHVGAPSPGLSLILTLRDHPVTLTPTHHGDQGSTTFSGVVAGLQLSPVLIAHEASSHTLTVHLTPAGRVVCSVSRRLSWWARRCRQTPFWERPLRFCVIGWRWPMTGPRGSGWSTRICDVAYLIGAVPVG